MSSRGVPALQGEGGLSRYLTEIRKFPLLEPEEEYMLAKRWKEHEDPEAARKLITSHLRLVAKIAMGYRGYGLPLAEVVGEGNVGLIKAVERFDVTRKLRLSTYATFWIKQAIQLALIKTGRTIRVPAHTVALVTRAGLSAEATNVAGSSDQSTMSIFSPCSSLMTLRTRCPIGPMQEPLALRPGTDVRTAIFDR